MSLHNELNANGVSFFTICCCKGCNNVNHNHNKYLKAFAHMRDSGKIILGDLNNGAERACKSCVEKMNIMVKI